MKKYLLVFGIFVFAGHAFAGELKEPYQEMIAAKTEQSEDPADNDDLFSGITIKNGNTTMRSGTVLAMDPTALHGSGKIPREVLPYLSRSVVYASSGDASVSSSESHISNGQETSTESETSIPSGVTVSRRE